MYISAVGGRSQNDLGMISYVFNYFRVCNDLKIVREATTFARRQAGMVKPKSVVSDSLILSPADKKLENDPSLRRHAKAAQPQLGESGDSALDLTRLDVNCDSSDGCFGGTQAVRASSSSFAGFKGIIVIGMND
jgi:hypothetical protein